MLISMHIVYGDWYLYEMTYTTEIYRLRRFNIPCKVKIFLFNPQLLDLFFSKKISPWIRNPVSDSIGFG